MEFTNLFDCVKKQWWSYRGRKFYCSGIAQRFSVNSESELKELLFAEKNERRILTALLNELQPDDVFFDIGANLGLYSCFAAKKISSGKIYCFEPYPPNIAALQNNLTLNKIKAEILPVALSDISGNVRIKSYQSGNGVSGVAGMTDETGSNSIEVKACTGDELVMSGEVDQPNIVKIDVEGAEGLVVNGMKNIFQNNLCRLVLCEIHVVKFPSPTIMDFGTTPWELISILKSLGFRIEYMDFRGSEIHVIARKIFSQMKGNNCYSSMK